MGTTTVCPHGSRQTDHQSEERAHGSVRTERAVTGISQSWQDEPRWSARGRWWPGDGDLGSTRAVAPHQRAPRQAPRIEGCARRPSAALRRRNRAPPVASIGSTRKTGPASNRRADDAGRCEARASPRLEPSQDAPPSLWHDVKNPFRHPQPRPQNGNHSDRAGEPCPVVVSRGSAQTPCAWGGPEWPPTIRQQPPTTAREVGVSVSGRRRRASL